jgi:hypothetical protein
LMLMKLRFALISKNLNLKENLIKISLKPKGLRN